MNRIRLSLVVLVAALAACSGDSPITTPTVASVEVTPGSTTLPAVGATVQFTARATDATGQVVTGATITWSSSDAAVATVSATGVATGVAVGTAAITATAGGAAGSAVVTVQQCQDPEAVNLSVGVYQGFETSDCIILPSGANGDRYRVAVIQTSELANDSDVEDVTLRTAGLGVLSSPQTVLAPSLVAPEEVLRFDFSQLREAVRRADDNAQAHLRHLEREAALVRALDRGHLLRTRDRSDIEAVAGAPSPASRVFDVSFKAQCATDETYQRTATLLYENEDLAVYQDSIQYMETPISVALASQMADYYAEHGRDMITSYFGEPSDIDGNGKLVLLAMPNIDGVWDDAIAQVSNTDFFDKTAPWPEGCASSNEMELMYFDSDIILNMEDGNFQALGTVAHEAKHVVSLYHRLLEYEATGTYEGHPGWIEEGTAEVAGEMSARIAWAARGGPDPGEEISRTDFGDYQQATGNAFDASNYSIALKMARTVNYLSSQPNSLVVAPDHPDSNGVVYGSGWLFHRWMADAYGGAGSGALADSALFRALADPTSAAGKAGLAQETGKALMELFEEFVVSVSLHATQAPAQRDFTTYELVSAAEIFCSPNPLGVFPWPVTSSGTAGDCDSNTAEASTPSSAFRTTQFTGPIGAMGMRIHEFVSNGTGTGMQLQLSMSRPGKILVMRLR